MAEVLTAAPIVAKVQAKSTSSILISFKAAVSSQALACIAGYKITFAYCRDGGAGACLAPSFIPPLSFCTPILPCTPRRAIPPVITPPSLNSRLLTSGPFPFGAFFQNGCTRPTLVFHLPLLFYTPILPCTPRDPSRDHHL